MTVILNEEKREIGQKIFNQIKNIISDSEDLKKLNGKDYLEVTWSILRSIVGYYIWAISEKDILRSFRNSVLFKEEIEDFLMEIASSAV